MTRQEKQEALRLRGISQAEFAKQAGVKETSISLYLRRRFKSKKLDDHFSRIMQLPIVQR